MGATTAAMCAWALLESFLLLLGGQSEGGSIRSASEAGGSDSEADTCKLDRTEGCEYIVPMIAMDEKNILVQVDPSR